MMNLSSESALTEINNITKNITSSGEDEEFLNKLVESIKESPEVFRQNIKGSDNIDVTKQVIGRKGYYLRLTTEKTGVFFIWHNHEDKTYTIWSPNKEALERAIGVINHRIKITTYRNKQPEYHIGSPFRV
jgi:hypothetical protein